MVDDVAQLVFLHMRPHTFAQGWTDSAVRRFARDVGEYLDDLLDLSRADITSKYAEKVRRGLRQIDRLAERIAEPMGLTVVEAAAGIARQVIEALGVEIFAHTVEVGGAAVRQDAFAAAGSRRREIRVKRTGPSTSLAAAGVEPGPTSESQATAGTCSLEER